MATTVGSSGASLDVADLPECVWSNEVLFLPAQLGVAHKDQLVAMGMLDAYLAQPDKPNAIGGNSAEAATEHFVWRFLNSAARAEYVCADPTGANEPAKNLLLEQLTDGAVHVLDIAAGHGAGTLAILSFIGVMREQSTLPKLPLNVAITALDYSADALAKYQEIAANLSTWLAEQGVHVTVDASLVDMRLQGEVSLSLDVYFADAAASGCKRFLCILSAIGGVGAEMISEMQGSFQEIAARIGNKPGGSWIWIEPPVSGKWLDNFIAGIVYTLKKIKHKLLLKGGTFDVPAAGTPFPGFASAAIKFKWRDPYTVADLFSHVRVASVSVGE
jgi:hypothetical protein